MSCHRKHRVLSCRCACEGARLSEFPLSFSFLICVDPNSIPIITTTPLVLAVWLPHPLPRVFKVRRVCACMRARRSHV
jgi:hypothetical protein